MTKSTSRTPVLSPVNGKPVLLDFDGAETSSDAGLTLLREVARRHDLAGLVASCLTDLREPGRTRHHLEDIIRFRIMMIAAGYEDGNDADDLRHDPSFKLALERDPETDDDPGSGRGDGGGDPPLAPTMETFSKGRDVAARVGLTPRQHSSGGKDRLGRTSKMGQRDIRRLLIVGAVAVVRWSARKGAPEGTWLGCMMARKPKMLVAVALANRMARTAWALLRKGEDYRHPAMAAA